MFVEICKCFDYLPLCNTVASKPLINKSLSSREILSQKKQKTKLWTENVIPHLQVNKWGTKRDSKKNHGQPQNFIFLPDVVREHLWHMPISHLRINIKCKYSSLKSVYRDCSRDFTSFITNVVLLLLDFLCSFKTLVLWFHTKYQCS